MQDYLTDSSSQVINTGHSPQVVNMGHSPMHAHLLTVTPGGAACGKLT